MSMKRLRQGYRDSASKLHRKVGAILKADPLLQGLRIYQEWPIPNSRYFVDWFLPDIKMAFECHGEQHAMPVAFDGDKEEAKRRFERQKIRDEIKKQLCSEAGWVLVELWYNDNLTAEFIGSKIATALGAVNDQPTPGR
jgi:very-short-patch-repair endonuclease